MGLLDSEFVTRDDLILFNRAALPEDTKKHIDDLVKRRDEVRSRKDWKESDRIRDELKAMGVVIKDNKDGTTSWEIAR